MMQACEIEHMTELHARGITGEYKNKSMLIIMR